MTTVRLRLVIATAALLMAAAALFQDARLSANRSELLAVLDATGVGDAVPGLEDDLRKEPSRQRARQRAARALVSTELDNRDANPLTSPDSVAQSLERLERASQLAAGVLARQPAAWQSALALGTANYLAAARARTAQPTAALDAWRAPLERARLLAPHQPEPPRLLAAAYIGGWPQLPQEVRDQALPVVEAAFRDPASFELLFEQWLRVVPSLEVGLSVVPREPLSWKMMQRHYAKQLDWERYCMATEGLVDVLETDFEERLDTAETMLRTGDEAEARRVLLSIPLDAPPSRRFAPQIESVLSRLPAGPIEPRYQRSFRLWLDWALNRCLYDSCVIGKSALGRLARLSELTEASEIAFAALAAGDRSRADLYSERSTVEPDSRWTRFHLLEARVQLAQRDREAARRSLDRVPATERGHALYRSIEDALQPLEAARSPASRRWQRADWDWTEKLSRLELMVPEPGGDGLRISIRHVHPDGAAVELRLDGTVYGWEAVRSGRTIRLRTPVAPGLHHLEVAVLKGRPVGVGDVALLPATAR